jgi:mono/diheme cytochrome c family protein
MSQEANPTLPTRSEAATAGAAPATVPLWLIVLFFVAMYWGMVYFDLNGGWFSPAVYGPYKTEAQLALYQPPTGGPDLGRAKMLYDTVCALCHNPDGTGKPGQGPPFIGSEWVVGNPNRLIRIPQYGLTGAIKVKDQEYNLNMAAMGAGFTDEDLAGVLTYIRSSWGNKAEPVTAEQVNAVRKQVGNRPTPFTVQDLNAVQ